MDLQLGQLSDEALEQELRNRKLLKTQQDAEKRAAYESMKSELVVRWVLQALELETLAKELNAGVRADLESFAEIMREYGEIKKNSKGGFSIEDKDFQYRIRLRYKTISDFDERADLAEKLLRDFFERTLKVTDQTVFDMFMKLLERKKGKLEASGAMEILSFQDRYDDEEWQKGCKLLRESFHPVGSKYYVEFEVKDDEGKWRVLALNFSSL